MMTRIAIHNGNDPNAEGFAGDENLLHLLVDYCFLVTESWDTKFQILFPLEADLSALVGYLLSVHGVRLGAER
jgi:hypothetical protein